MTMTSAVPAQVACGPLRPCAPRAVAGLGVQCGVGGLAVGQTGHCLRAWQAAATRYGTSSQSELPPAGMGHSLTPSSWPGPAWGPRNFAAAAPGRGEFRAPPSPRSSGEEGGERMSSPRPAARGPSEEDGGGDGERAPGPLRCRPRFCAAVAGREPCVFALAVCPLSLTSVDRILHAGGDGIPCVKCVCDTS